MTLLLRRQDVAGLMDLERAMSVLVSVMVEEAEGTSFHVPPFGGSKSERKTFRLVGGGLYGIGRMGIRLSGVHLLDAQTGELLAIVGGDAPNLRIAATMALAARYLARPDARSIAILGSGRNALLILEGLKMVRPIERVNVFSPTPAHRARLAERASATLEIPATAQATLREAIAGMDIIVVATSSYTPVLAYSDLRPGVHVTSMGMTTELDESIFLNVDQFVAQNREQEIDCGRPDVHPHVEGLLWKMVGEGRYDPARIVELGSIIKGKVGPRNGPSDITLFRDSRGGVSDIALANDVYERARAQGLGIEFEL